MFSLKKKPASSIRAFTSPVSLPGPKAGPAGLSKKARGGSEGNIYNIFLFRGPFRCRHYFRNLLVLSALPGTSLGAPKELRQLNR